MCKRVRAEVIVIVREQFNSGLRHSSGRPAFTLSNDSGHDGYCIIDAVGVMMIMMLIMIFWINRRQWWLRPFLPECVYRWPREHCHIVNYLWCKPLRRLLHCPLGNNGVLRRYALIVYIFVNSFKCWPWWRKYGRRARTPKNASLQAWLWLLAQLTTSRQL